MTTNQTLILAPAVFILIGLAMLWIGVRSCKLARASKSWPKATGKILSNEVRRYDSTDGDNRARYSYKLELVYEYVVGNSVFRGNRVQFGLLMDFNTAARATKVAARYPIGAQVDVYYDPAQPSQCTLEQATAGSVVAIIIIGIFFIVFPPLVSTLLYILVNDNR